MCLFTSLTFRVLLPLLRRGTVLWSSKVVVIADVAACGVSVLEVAISPTWHLCPVEAVIPSLAELLTLVLVVHVGDGAIGNAIATVGKVVFDTV